MRTIEDYLTRAEGYIQAGNIRLARHQMVAYTYARGSAIRNGFQQDNAEYLDQRYLALSDKLLELVHPGQQPYSNQSTECWPHWG